MPKSDFVSVPSSCTLCPRRCGADRAAGRTGFCGAGGTLKAARAALHYWEEPCISGTKGSGTVFFSGCTLKCCFCQNYPISAEGLGKEISVKHLAEIFLNLQEQGANNINLVTPDHYIPQIISAIDMARSRNFKLPFVYNCSGYETAEMIQLLDSYIDVYLPDFKFMSPDLSAKYSNAPDYPEHAKASISEMVRQCGGDQTRFDDDGIMQRGVIVRHLQLPDHLDDSKSIITYLYNTYKDSIYISIMNQYTPMPGIENRFPELGRTITSSEYDELVDYAIDIGVENGFIQEGETAKESFIPAFDNEGV